LFTCHQWLAYYLGVDFQPFPNFGATVFFKEQNYESAAARAQAIYDEWDNITAILFEILDALNVLNEVLIIANPDVVLPYQVKASRAQTNLWNYPGRTLPSACNVVPFQEIYPLPKEPFLFENAPQDVQPDEAPEASYNIWVPDNEDTSGAYDDGDINLFGYMRDGVNFTLDKLETLRRWIGKIRFQMPWYKGVPMEKLLPGRPTARDPFTGQPIESP
jgi:hypothetical protein